MEDSHLSISESLRSYIDKTFFNDKISKSSKTLLFFIEFFHLIVFILCPLGFFLPPRFLLYHCLFLTSMMISWFIFNGCFITKFKEHVFDIHAPLLSLDLELLKIIQSLLIVMSIVFYIFPSKAPFVFLKRGIRFLDSL